MGVAAGLLLGIGSFTFIYARGASYLTNDPKACADCHVMQEQFDGWQRSSHRSVAVCNDCREKGLKANSMGFHAPQESMRVLALSLDHARKGQMALRPR
jgi:nitrate/TMAO reductase-like tetraheme cytochrome c subunit